MGIDTSAPVMFSAHALARLRERWPHLLVTPRGKKVGAGAYGTWEVHAALQAGRTSKKIPREYRRGDKFRRSQGSTKPSGWKANKGRDTPSRYAWSEDGLRCYVLHWRTNAYYGKGEPPMCDARKLWVVSTVLPKAREIIDVHAPLEVATDG